MSILATVLPAAIGIAQTFGQTAVSAWQGHENLKYQKDAMNWQKYAQEKTWTREDNATQRRVADLRAAGLSPTLAAGSAAETHTPIKVDAPQRDKIDMPDMNSQLATAMSIYQGMMQAQQARQNIATSREQEQYLRVQQNKAAAETAERLWNLEQAKNAGISTNPSAIGKIYKDGVGIWGKIKGFFNNSTDGVPTTIDGEPRNAFQQYYEFSAQEKARKASADKARKEVNKREFRKKQKEKERALRAQRR